MQSTVTAIFGVVGIIKHPQRAYPYDSSLKKVHLVQKVLFLYSFQQLGTIEIDPIIFDVKSESTNMK